jgi:hypothetical protein
MTTNQGLIHGAPNPGLCCDAGWVAKLVSGVWICRPFDDCSFPAPSPPPLGSGCDALQACCADIVQTGPSVFEPMCIPVGVTSYLKDFTVY